MVCADSVASLPINQLVDGFTDGQLACDDPGAKNVQLSKWL
jgi:hypothetical protein